MNHKTHENSSLGNTKVILLANTDWYIYNFRLHLCHFLREAGFEPVILTPPGDYLPIFEREGLRWIRWDLGRYTVNPFHEIAALTQLHGILRREKPLLVHNHTVKPVIYGSIAARLAKIPFIINSIPGRGYVFSNTEIRARLLRLLVSTLYRISLPQKATKVIFENEGDRQYFLSHRMVNEAQAALIQSVGVDINRFTVQTEAVGTPLVVMASRLIWDKGVGVFVEAARLLKAKADVRMALVGLPDPGNPRSVPEETLREWEKQGWIEWWGWEKDMLSVYQRSHIVVLPTLYGEGVPTVLIEAAACGRPIVASDTPGCREIIQDGGNGYLVPQSQPKALADALLKIINSPERRRQMGEAGRSLVETKFSKEIVNLATLELYQTLIRDRR